LGAAQSGLPGWLRRGVPSASWNAASNAEAYHVDNMRIWMHPFLPRRNLRIVIHRWGSLSCAWRPTDSELHRWPVDPTSGNVKLLLPPRQSRGNSHYGLGQYSTTRIGGQPSPPPGVRHRHPGSSAAVLAAKTLTTTFRSSSIREFDLVQLVSSRASIGRAATACGASDYVRYALS
jgi:hypothetical protein